MGAGLGRPAVGLGAGLGEAAVGLGAGWDELLWEAWEQAWDELLWEACEQGFLQPDACMGFSGTEASGVSDLLTVSNYFSLVSSLTSKQPVLFFLQAFLFLSLRCIYLFESQARERRCGEGLFHQLGPLSTRPQQPELGPFSLFLTPGYQQGADSQAEQLRLEPAPTGNAGSQAAAHATLPVPTIP